MFGFFDFHLSNGLNIAATVIEQFRRETGDESTNPDSWTNTDEYTRFLRLLSLRPTAAVLDVGCGTGGPAIFLAETVGCEVVGIDSDERVLASAEDAVASRDLGRQVRFLRADAGRVLPFPDWRFDAVLCIDAVARSPDRLQALKEWRRVIRPGGRVLYTDPAVVTGLLTREEIADRGLLGPMQLSSPGVNERLIQAAGLELEEAIDVTGNVARLAERRRHGRAQRRDELIEQEGKETFDRLQRFLTAAQKLSSHRRLSRFAYVARKPQPAGCDF